MFGNTLEKSFYAVVIVFSLVLLATIVMGGRDSFYKKIEPSVCSQSTNEFEFDYEAQARLVSPSAKNACEDWQKIALPHYQAMPEYAGLPPDLPLEKLWFHFTYKIPEDLKPNTSVGIYSTRVVGGIFALYINDKLLLTNEEDWYMQWNYPFYAEIPMAYLQPGNEIDIKVAIPYRKVAGFSIGSFYAGDARILKNWKAWREFFSIQLPIVFSILFLTFGVISLFLAWFNIDRKNNTLFSVIALIYAVLNMQFIYNIPDNRAIEYWYLSITDSSISWFFAISTLYASYYAKEQLRWLANIAIVWAITVTIVTLPMWEWEVIGFLAQHYITFVLYMALLISLVYTTIKEKNSSLGVVTACIFIYMLGGFYDLTHVSNQTYPDGYYLFTYATLPLLFFFLISLQKKYISSHRLLLKNNEIMQEKLQEQEEKLNEQHQQLLIQSRKIVEQAERARLKDDLHDGVASSLYLLMLNLPDSKEDMQEALQELVDDIQCVVLSRQSESSLNDVLASYRSRIIARVEGACIKLDWQVDDVSELSWLEPSDVLCVLRLLQEAVTNALKHSKCTQLSVIAKLNPAKNSVEISVQDNGEGYDLDSVSGGNGRRSMRHRAESLGAELVKHSCPTGTSVSLLIPLQKSAAKQLTS